MRDTIDRSICDTVEAYLGNPTQLHGDTGIMHFLYHRMMTHGGESVFKCSPNGVKTLLIQSEQYTTLPYLHKGSKPTPARMDYAILSPDIIPSNGQLPTRNVRAAVGLEVGRNKDLCRMGSMEAGLDCQNVRPGDAAKLIRELRFGGMKHAYLLEFYDSAEYFDEARSVFQAVTDVCRQFDVQRLHFVLAMKGNGDNEAWVSVYPQEWQQQLRLPYPPLPEQSPEVCATTAAPVSFWDQCGPCNRALVERLKEDFGSDCTWGKKSMTIRRPRGPGGCLWMRVTNQSHADEEQIQEIHPRLAEFLEQAGIDIIDGDTVVFPDEQDDDFVEQIVQSLHDALLGPAPPTPPPLQRTFEAYYHHCGPCNRLLQERLRTAFPGNGARCLWGNRNMTIRQPERLIVRICNRADGQRERMMDLDARLIEALTSRGVNVAPGGCVYLPEEEDRTFVDNVLIAALSVV